MDKLVIKPGQLRLPELKEVLRDFVKIDLDKSAISGIEQSHQTVLKILKSKRRVYGINTGFGLLANKQINADELCQLQQNLVLSHAAGYGELIAPDLVKLIMLLKINSLARGFSGVRAELIQALIDLYNSQIYPCIPQKGSVGASGDLAPLAHLSSALIAVGNVHYQNQIISANEVYKLTDLQPVTLEAKEGLALLNGTQVSTAYALQGLLDAENLFASALVIGSMSVEAALGSRAPFDPKIHQVRGHQSQIDTAAAFRKLLQHSAIEESHQNCDRVQDPYSLRCQPQVMGACLQQIRDAAKVIMTEANAVSDNPLVFSQQEDILSGGNFHAEPIAMAADNLALAIAEIGALAERRISLLVDAQLSNLPPFLVENSGVNSGFMIAQVTAAALASENKSLAHPAVVDSLPTSANQEDHVSMATFAARRLQQMVQNTLGILAIEYLAAAQGLDFRKPLGSSPTLEQAKSYLRAQVPFYAEDRYFADDIKKASKLISDEVLLNLVDDKVRISI